MMDWLNDNSGALQAIAVIVLAVFTFLYALMTALISRDTRRQANEIRQQRLDERRPVLLIDLSDYRGKMAVPSSDDAYPNEIKVRITNVGSGPAIDVDVTAIHPKARYGRTEARGYLLPNESMTYETGESPYPAASGRGLADLLRDCGVEVDPDHSVGLVARYRDEHERPWIAWMALKYDWFEADNEAGYIWVLLKTEQRRSLLSSAGRSQSDSIFS